MIRDGLTERLAEPFEPGEVKWKAQVVRSNRALAVAYVDARAVEDRLDAVFGVDGWQDAYQVLPNNNVICKLRVKVGDDWIERSDVGSQSDQPDEGDRMKSAFSDALKRAAVKFGIGRYLYRLPQQWVDYDAQTRQIKSPPRLPDWAHPGARRAARLEAKRAPIATEANGTITREQWEQIRANLVKNHVSQRMFLEHYHIAKPGDLTAERYGEALTLSQKPRTEWPTAATAPTASNGSAA